VRAVIAELLQVVANCKGYTRCNCNNSVFSSLLTYETPGFTPAISASKKGQLLQVFQKLLQPVAGFVAALLNCHENNQD